MKETFRFSLVFFLTVALLFLISPVAHTYGIRFAIYAPFYLGLSFFSLILLKKNINIVLVNLVLFAVVTSLAVALYHPELRFLWFSSNIIIAILIFSLIDRLVLQRIISLSTFIIFILLIGSWITSIKVAGSGMPDVYYVTSGGRVIQRGLFSLGYELWTPRGIFFRAASIYDEPGAFSFVICSIAALRHLLGSNKIVTWLLLIMGLVTLSLAHVIYMVFHFIAEKGITGKIYIVIILLFLLFILLLIDNHEITSAFLSLFQRFEITSGDQQLIKGDNRSSFLIISLNEIKEFNFFRFIFGSGEAYGCCNPLFPLADRGLLGAWPYYVTVSFFLISGLIKKNLVLIAIFLLFMQRPEVQSAGYSFLAAAILHSVLIAHYNSSYFEYSGKKGLV